MLSVTLHEDDVQSVHGSIETVRELEIAREALGPAIYVAGDLRRDSNGIFYRYQAIEIGNYVSWMVKV